MSKLTVEITMKAVAEMGVDDGVTPEELRIALRTVSLTIRAGEAPGQVLIESPGRLRSRNEGDHRLVIETS